jgi:hypothetical protein
MKLHKSLTTVTPFSKAIALILFITLPFLGFILGMQYQATIDISLMAIPYERGSLVTPAPLK